MPRAAQLPPITALQGPRSRVRDRNGRRILAAVRDHIDDHGLEQASMRELADVADVSVRTLYNLFGDRNGLIRALVHQSLADVDLATGDVGATDPVERIWDTVDVAIATITASLPRSVLAPVLTDDELLGQLSQRWHVRGLMIDGIRTAQRSGQLYDDIAAELLVEQVGMTLIQLLRGWAAGTVDDDGLRAGALHAVDVSLLAVAPPQQRAVLRDHAESLVARLPAPRWTGLVVR